MSTERDITMPYRPGANEGANADEARERKRLLNELKALADEAVSRGVNLRRLNATGRFLRLTESNDFAPESPEVMVELIDAKAELVKLLDGLKEDSIKRDARIAAVRGKIWIAIIVAFLGGVSLMRFCSQVQNNPAPAAKTDRTRN